MVLIFCKVKNKQKTTTSTQHYVNRLVPKNDIKLLVNVYKTSKIDTLLAWNNKNYRYVGDVSLSKKRLILCRYL